ncbi:hypothetical protein [Sphingomonas sp. VNH70]|uniref:hypothetical protein n=1 Tax=Sphingomonas silueang TaxID=3156617 RepID=UPI0032B419AF
MPLALAACGGDDAVPANPATDAGELVECAATPDAALARTCSVEQTLSADGTILTVRQADGGFRRLRITRDGQGVVAADGAEPARVTIVGSDAIEVAIGGARYRLPATIGPVAKR